jgi:phosphoribosylanthranilate isomerase
MLVKICGITSTEMAKKVAEAGADMIGFVFAPSKRQITLKEAAIITRALPPSVKTVGVFVNESIAKMQAISELTGLDYIQLHGDEAPSVAKKLRTKVIKSFPADSLCSKIKETRHYDFILIDSPAGKYRGGNGRTFDWKLAKNVPKQNVILAGGLTPENVQQAIDIVQPAGVDVSSGVETDGVKDPEKIRKFIQNAKGGSPIEKIYNA